MLIVAVAWLYVALMMAVAEATHAQGTLLGALITFVLYGLAPVALVLYIGSTKLRRRIRAAREREEEAPPLAAAAVAASAQAPDQRGHAAGAAVAPEREVP